MEEVQKKEKLVIYMEKNELRTRTAHITIEPSVHAAAKKKCDTIGVSFSEAVNQLIKNWLKKE